MVEKSKSSISMREHMKNSKTVIGLIEDANVIAGALSAELRNTRQALSDLVEFQHPKLMINVRHDRQFPDQTEVDTATFINTKIKSIDAVIGIGS